MAARIAFTAAMIAGVLIVLGIAFSVFNASSSNSIVSSVLSIDQTLVRPFKGMFNLQDARMAIVVNWGVGAAVYVLAGQLLARILK